VLPPPVPGLLGELGVPGELGLLGVVELGGVVEPGAFGSIGDGWLGEPGTGSVGVPGSAGVTGSAGAADPGWLVPGEAGCIWLLAGVVSPPSSEPPHPKGAASRTNVRASGFFIRVS
jgi:hypothetical protein